MIDDEHIASIQTLYSQLKIFPQPSQFTILAAIYLVSNTSSEHKIISLGTGTKCLPESRLTTQGEAIHDSHAEVLARRGAIRWLLEEILRERGNSGSQWVERHKDGSYRLQKTVELRMYISTVPCGDASTRFLAAFQDPDIASLKDAPSSSPAVLPEGSGTARGRDNYHLFNVLRTKPGRADSPPTLSLSCSDKIASWAWLGFQGSLLAKLFNQGIYVQKLIIGEVLSTGDTSLVKDVAEDCKRALGGRLQGILPVIPEEPYTLHVPEIAFTSVPFIHSRISLGLGASSTSTFESLCWRADSLSTSSKKHNLDAFQGGSAQVLINGFKRGASPKHRQRVQDDKFLPHLCKLSMFKLYAKVCKKVYDEEISTAQTYCDVKVHGNRAYYEAKTRLKGPLGPFSAWWGRRPIHPHPTVAEEDKECREDEEQLGRWENFSVEGKVVVR